jgi:hypothetical protein
MDFFPQVDVHAVCVVMHCDVTAAASQCKSFLSNTTKTAWTVLVLAGYITELPEDDVLMLKHVGAMV